MLVLGVDPGSLVTGYGLVEKKTINLLASTQARLAHPATRLFM
jgi:Holliday junction resolvasome RuvABC endonuclease subunit